MTEVAPRSSAQRGIVNKFGGLAIFAAIRPKPSPCLGLVSARIAAASCVVELELGEVALPSVQQLAAKIRGPSYLAPASQARGILRSVSERTLLCQTARLALDSHPDDQILKVDSVQGLIRGG